MVTVLIAGGGTGGHIFPMLAVGAAVRAIEPDSRVFYVGTPRGMEGRVFGSLGLDLELLDVAPLRGGGLSGLASGSWKAARSLAASRALVKRRRPDVVLSVGGYAGGPVALAARALGVPLAILEPNSVFGFTNKVLSPLADRVYWAFGDVDKKVRTGRAVRSGVPLRAGFTAAPYEAVAGRFHVAVFGGSQGAKALNASMPSAFIALKARVPHATLLHQCGRGRTAETIERYAPMLDGFAGSSTEQRLAALSAKGVQLVEFVDDVFAELARADVVVERSGAGALAELCLVGRASILVPFQFAVDDHQWKNAKALADAGAATLIHQRDATADALVRALVRLAEDAAERTRLASRARSFAAPDAARTVAKDLLRLAARHPAS